MWTKRLSRLMRCSGPVRMRRLLSALCRHAEWAEVIWELSAVRFDRRSHLVGWVQESNWETAGVLCADLSPVTAMRSWACRRAGEPPFLRLLRSRNGSRPGLLRMASCGWIAVPGWLGVPLRRAAAAPAAGRQCCAPSCPLRSTSGPWPAHDTLACRVPRDAGQGTRS